jgi:GNAT superfamily N-acetyltransferase
MERFADDLQGYGLAKGTIRFPIGEPLPRPLVKTVVKAKLEELRRRAPSAARRRRDDARTATSDASDHDAAAALESGSARRRCHSPGRVWRSTPAPVWGRHRDAQILRDRRSRSQSQGTPSARLTRIVSGSSAPRVRNAEPPDRAIVESFLDEHATARVARLGQLVDARKHPALIAEDDTGVLAGVLTYVLERDGCEILTLHAAQQWRGAGTALIEEVERIASSAGCRRLWLITTNDNIEGIRFYQRRGFHLAELHAGAVDRSRESLKPEIPAIGVHGIPIRDELELEKLLQP